MVDTHSTEELLATHKRWKYDRTDRNGTRYFTDCTCGRCGGRGVIDGYRYVDGGICFECGGTGVSKPTTIKVYTPEHDAKLAAQREARAKKRDAEAYQRLCGTYVERMEKAGFGHEGEEWVVYRILGETYSIKDELKEQGCKFKPQIGWYSAKPLDNHKAQRMVASDVLEDAYPLINWKSMDDCHAAFVEEKAEGPQTEFVGEVGERKQFVVDVKRIIELGVKSYYGHSSMTYMHVMEDEGGHCLIWVTSNYLGDGRHVINGTIKEHKEYKGVAQTVLTRCKEVE